MLILGNTVLNEISIKTAQFVEIARLLIQEQDLINSET